MIECSAGTYVRSLIAGLGDAYCTELRRTRIGAFDVADADEERLIPLDDALAFLPALELDRRRRAARVPRRGGSRRGFRRGPAARRARPDRARRAT